jgi:hypothetical protein
MACTACYTHRPYLPDLATSDFYFFPAVKENSKGFRWLTRTMQEILKCIDQKELNGIFHAWVRGVQEISQGNENYVR